MKLKMKTTATLLIAIFLVSTLAVIIPVLANTVESSTMHFEGELTDNGDGTYTGTIDMTAGEYYVPGGPGAGIHTGGGFDVYAKEGATAYVMNYYGATGDEMGSYVIGTLDGAHDAYPDPGGPWGDWYNPDCADWYCYSLELTANRWYLRYTPTGESPMSGIMMWRGEGIGYAAETDKGTYDPEDDGLGPYLVYEEGGPQMWDWDAGAQVERIPLEYQGFKLVVEEQSLTYHVTLTPAPLRGPTPITIPMHQVQIQCRRWDPAGWRYWYHDYPITWDFKGSGNVLHTEISYQPAVSEEVGTSHVYVYNKKEGLWIMHEGTIEYVSPKSGLWITEYWKGYLDFEGKEPNQENFVHGVGYQWGYVFGLDEETVKKEYPFAVWDDTMDAWDLGFSIYIWDKTSFDQSDYFYEDVTGDWCPLCSRYEKPTLTWDEVKDLEPVPKSDYNPLDQ